MLLKDLFSIIKNNVEGEIWTESENIQRESMIIQHEFLYRKIGEDLYFRAVRKFTHKDSKVSDEELLNQHVKYFEVTGDGYVIIYLDDTLYHKYNININ